MYFRCTDCYAATWVQSVDASAESQTLKCQTCNRGFTVRAAANLSPDPRAQYETALALAEGNGFDLPTSYSVLLGIMTLEHAMVMRDRGLPAREVTPPAGDPTTEDGAAAAAPRADAKRREIPSAANVIEYDPAFADAVAHGYLSTQQAIERGDRTKFAKRAAELHGLSESLAFMVADNKISVTTAIHKSREEVAAVLRPAKVRTWKRALVAAVGALVLVAVGIYSLHLWSGIEEKNRKAEEWTETVTAKIEKNREPEPRGRLERLPGEVPKRRVRIQKDTEGRVIEIVGPDPSSVLLAYCANQEPAERFHAIELTAAVPAYPGTKLGVFEDGAEIGKRYAIRIRRTINGRRWVAGDGEKPIAATVAPLLPEDAPRVPVLRNEPRTKDS
jgi:hypothetical protein